MKKLLYVFLSLMTLTTVINTYTYAESSSNLQTNISIVKHSNGVATEIFRGLSNDFDFSSADAWIIFSWDNDECYVIKQAEDETVSAESDSVSFSKTHQAALTNIQSNLMGNGSDFTVSSQIKINNVNVGETGSRIIDDANMECSFEIGNNTSSEKTLSLILATYDNAEKLVNVKTANVNISSMAVGSVNLVYQFNSETDKNAKLMLWDISSGNKPVKASVSFNQDSGINAYYYNADNRLLQVDKMNETSLYYTYDSMGNLLAKTVYGGEEND